MNLSYSIRSDDNRKKSKFTLEHIPRCPECNLICSLHLYQDSNIPTLLYFCENKHKGNIPLNKYIKTYKQHSLTKEKCECNNNKKENECMYCTNCKKFICLYCIMEKHKLSNGHLLMNLNKFDSLCKIHFNSFCSYCNNCKMNICEMCYKEHINHNLIGLSNIIISQEIKDNLNKLINELKVRVSEIEVIKNDIVKKLNELKENLQNEIELAVILLETYEFEIEQKNLNYYNTSNLIGLGNTFKQFYNDFQIKINKSKEIIEIFNYFNTYDGEENKITDNENKINDNENKINDNKNKINDNENKISDNENKINNNENKISDNENNNYNKLLVKFNNNLDLLKRKIKDCNILKKENNELKLRIETIQKKLDDVN